MRGRIIELEVTDKRGKASKTIPLYQYDYGQKLLINGVELPEYYEVHFSNQQYGDAITVLGDSTGVLIPDSLVATGETIYVWLFLHDTSYDGETEYMGAIPVIKRAQPTDITPTPEEQSIITEVIAALNNMEDDMSEQVQAAESAKEAAQTAQTAAEGAATTASGYVDAVTAAQAAAEAAQAAAETAATSATASATSATSSANSANNALAEAVNAKIAAVNAADSASTSATSASTASGNAANSANSAESAKVDAVAAATAAGTAQTAAETAQGKAEDAKDAAEADALIAEGYAVGKQDGDDVASGSTYYHNNAKYYADAASDSATAAAGSEDNAEDSAEDAEAYAVGTRGGVDVESDDPAYENNAKYYAEQAATAMADKLDAPATAGTQGQVLTSDGEGGQAWADPSGAIDDTAGEGDTDVTWSADKLTDEFTDVLNAIQGKPDMKATDADSGTFDIADENGNVVLRLESGEVETKNFSSAKAPAIKTTDANIGIFDIADNNGNVVVRIAGGDIQTKKFNSAELPNPIEYKFSGSNLLLAYKYTSTKDAVVVLNNGRANELFDFSKFCLKPTGTPLKDLETTDLETVWTSGTDMHSPFQFNVTTDADGYYASSTDPSFTGGNHTVEINGSNIKSASSKYVYFFADGEPVSDGYGLCNHFTMKWANEVQAYNCVKTDGTGRTSLIEYHEMIFDGVQFNEEIMLVPKEEISMRLWYGLQSVSWKSTYTKARFIDGTNRNEFTDEDGSITSGNAKTSGVIETGTNHSMMMTIDICCDLGERPYYTGTSGAFIVSYGTSGKGYFNIINQSVTMGEGDAYILRGSYRFYPTVA